MGTAVDRLEVKLAAVAIPGHVRKVKGKTVRVKPHSRKLKGLLGDTLDAHRSQKTRSAAQSLVGTVKKEGGFSVRIPSGQKPKGGYMVATPNAEDVFEIGEMSDDEVALRLMRYQLQHADKLKDKNAYFGGWLERETGKVYLDVSLHFDSIDEAIDLGYANDQEAIFDLNTMEEIRLKETKDKDGNLVPIHEAAKRRKKAA